MQPFIRITAHATPIRRSDIDTDQIIPAAYLSITTKEGLGQHLFAVVKKEDDFAAFRTMTPSPILITRGNFGCGSSREHAAWALTDHGVRTVIAPSFADIFYGNALKNGLLPLLLPEAAAESLLEKALKGSYELTVDLEKQVVTESDGTEHRFLVDAFRKECLLQGLDDIDYLLSKKEVIAAFDEEHKSKVFFSL